MNTTKKPLVTIGVSCYNCREFLPLLLNSVAEQDLTDWEVVAIDDGSTDGTGNILRSYEREQIRVRVESSNLGLGARLNQITECARGDYIARVDADDILHPQRLWRQLEILTRNPSLDGCVTGSYCIDENNRLVGIRSVPALARTKLQVMQRNGPLHPTLTAKRSWFRRFPYALHPLRGQDLDLWIRAVESTALMELRQPLHFIREPVAFDLGKYRRSMRDHRCIFRIHGPGSIGRARMQGLILRSYLKEAAYGAGCFLGIARWLAERRNEQTPQLHRSAIQEWLDRLASTSPGEGDVFKHHLFSV